MIRQIKTLTDLKNFINTLTTERLSQNFTLHGMETAFYRSTEVEVTEEQFLKHKTDEENVGTESECRSYCESECIPFNLNYYEVVAAPGLIIFYCE